jgi:hypothetical protein
MDLIENGGISSLGLRHPWELARYKIIKRNVYQAIKKFGPSLMVVDIGCGDAYVIRRLQKDLNLHHAVGVDINFSEENLDVLKKENTGVSFYRNFLDISIDRSQPCLILLNDVMEHVEDDRDFLCGISNHFSGSKHLLYFITVPAFQFLFSKHDVNLLHFRRYTYGGLVQLSGGYGLRIREGGYFFLSLLIIRFLQVVIEKLRQKSHTKGEDIGVNHWQGSEFTTRMIASILYIDYIILLCFSKLGLRIPGLSVWVHAERERN